MEDINSFKDAVNDENRCKIKSIWVKLGSMHFDSLQLKFNDGQLSKVYGDSTKKPNYEYLLPEKVISKIYFHKGK